MNYDVADTILGNLALSYPHEVPERILRDFCKSENEFEIGQTLQELILENWIQLASGSSYVMTENGRILFSKYGSFSVYEDAKWQQEKSRSQIDKLTVKKLKYDVMIAKWQSWLFVPTSVLGILGGLCGVLSLVIKVWPEPEPKKAIRIEEPLIEKVDTLQSVKKNKPLKLKAEQFIPKEK